MSTGSDQAIAAAIEEHLRASGEPVREAYLYERVCGDDVNATPDEFLCTLLRLETEGHVHMDPVHDEREDRPPFQPRFWRIIE